MKIKISIFIIALSALAFQVSPYARRIRPFSSTPASCQENEIGYNMTSHSLVICTNSGYQLLTTGSSGSFAPSNATYITQTANGTLTNEQALGGLATGILKNTTTTGVLSIAAAGDVNSILPTQTGNSGKFLTTNGTVSSWTTISTGITNAAGNNVIPKSDGTNLVASRITDNATDITINSGNGITFLGDTTAGANGSFIKIDDANKTITIDADDNNTGSLITLVGGASPAITIFNGSGVGSISLAANGDQFFGNGTTSIQTKTSTPDLVLTATNTSISLVGATAIEPTTDGITNLGGDGTAFKQLYLDATITAGGTTGAQTIDKSAGSVNFAAAASSLVVTNSLVTANSIIICTVATNDTTLKSVQCVPASGSFTMFANAAATAETRINFLVINQ